MSRLLVEESSVAHDPVYAVLRQDGGFLTMDQILRRLAVPMEVPAFERHLAHLKRDFRIEVETRKTGDAYKLGEFKAFVGDVLAAVEKAPAGADAKALPLRGKTVADIASELTGKIGEKIDVRRWGRVEIAQGKNGLAAAYVHDAQVPYAPGEQHRILLLYLVTPEATDLVLRTNEAAVELDEILTDVLDPADLPAEERVRLALRSAA